MRGSPLSRDEIIERLKAGDRIMATKGRNAASYSMVSDGAWVRISTFWALIDKLEPCDDGLIKDHSQTYKLRDW